MVIDRMILQIHRIHGHKTAENVRRVGYNSNYQSAHVFTSRCLPRRQAQAQLGNRHIVNGWHHGHLFLVCFRQESKASIPRTGYSGFHIRIGLRRGGVVAQPAGRHGIQDGVVQFVKIEIFHEGQAGRLAGGGYSKRARQELAAARRLHPNLERIVFFRI